ncbi:MAG: succinyl-diaminopimelate desuccinylase, partial [Rhodospirillales bacterium]
EDWTYDPFGAEIVDGFLYGRGSTDMKSGVAAFAAAAVDFVTRTPPDGAVILAITGDEEGDATDGTTALLDWMSTEQERMAVCLVGEPTSPDHMGQMMKIGRRGSMSAWFEVEGVQGHSAYPHLADNPVHRLVKLLSLLTEEPLDQGSAHFEPSTLQITTMDVGNPATNVIPAEATARFNVRFNDCHHSSDVEAWVRARMAKIGGDIGLDVKVSGESFLTPPGPLSAAVASAVEAVTQRRPELGTTGGTSDARFIKDACPVIELGLRNEWAHKVDERAPLEDIETLTQIYKCVLENLAA